MDINNNQGNNKGTNNIVGIIIVVVIVSALIGAGSVLAVAHYYPDFISNTVTNINKTEKEVTVTDKGIADAVEKVYDSVVVVETFSRGTAIGSGTGFIYKHTGDTYYIITNYHVIAGGDSVKLVLTDSDEEVEAKIVGGDEYADVAVLSYKSNKELKVATMGSSKDMRVGDTVFAIGAPLGNVYSWTVTRGILSGKDREVTVSIGNSQTNDWIMQVLQTDTAINSGNSGGPLCNSNGEVIGINNMKLVSSGVEGMGFSIPIEDAIDYADRLVNGDSVERPYLGVSMYDVSNTYYAYAYKNSSTNLEYGVGLSSVEEGSPADKAGLKAGDTIIGLNDGTIKDVATLRYKLYKNKVGDTIKITYVRNNKTETTKVTLGSKPKSDS